MDKRSQHSNYVNIEKYTASRKTYTDKISNIRLNLNSNHPRESENFIQIPENNETIFGTSIKVVEALQQIKNFMEGSRDSDNNSIYDILKSNVLNGNYSLPFDLSIMQAFDLELFNLFILFPNNMIELFDNLCTSWVRTEMRDNCNENLKIKTFPSRMPADQLLRIRDISVNHIGNLVCIRGLVLRTSEIIPIMVQGKFECGVCRDHTTSVLTEGVIQEEKFCDKCRNPNTYALKHNLSAFDDSQYIKLQETPEDLPYGETAQNLLVHVVKENVDKVKPGDRVEVIGIYTVDSRRENEFNRKTNTLMKTYISVVSFSSIERSKDSLAKQVDMTEGVFHEDRVQEFVSFSRRKDCIEQLVKNFAPSIYESEEVKFGLLTQLFGGVEKNMTNNQGSLCKRGEINVLLLGDPSTGKSQLLQYVNSVSPRGIYTSGKGSSAVGLTAHVMKDPETNELVLESGALVLSDRGICCIDEFDKMSESGRSVLHEVMEQQTISIAKAGIICNLNARTAILAAANPIESKYNPRLTVVKNLNLPPSLISRFDLIFIILDDIQEERDSKMASHILQMFSGMDLNHDNQDNDPNKLEKSFLKEYIAYARQHCKPRIITESYDLLVSKYLDMRRYGKLNKTISATPRQLESLIRLSESIAKMRLSNIVVAEDVERAFQLFQSATKQSLTDPNTGLIDMNMISGGMTNEDKLLSEDVKQSLMDYFDNHKAMIREGMDYKVVFEDIQTIFKDKGVNLPNKLLVNAFETLEEDNRIMIGGPHDNRTIKLIE